MNTYHSYMKYKDTCSRRINWIVLENNSKNIIGAVGVNSAVFAMNPRDDFIGWDKEFRLKNLVNIANNYRFCLIRENITIPRVGSQVLKALRFYAPIEWEKRYGDRLVLLETLVKPPWTGSVYKADNWIYVGKTKGISFSKAPLKSWQREAGKRGELARTNPEAAIKKYAVGGKMYNVKKSESKLIFVKPLAKDWKDFLNGKNNS